MVFETEIQGLYVTTKQQKKIGGVANNMVVSVNELPDGSAVEDISTEFEKLRVAEMLGIPNVHTRKFGDTCITSFYTAQREGHIVHSNYDMCFCQHQRLILT